MPSTSDAFRTTLDLFKTGLDLVRQNLRRDHPQASEDEIDAGSGSGFGSDRAQSLVTAPVGRLT